MKRYQLFANDPLKLAEYITNKLGIALETICIKTGNKFYHDNGEYAAVKGIILSELMEEVKENKDE